MAVYLLGYLLRKAYEGKVQGRSVERGVQQKMKMIGEVERRKEADG